LLQVEGQGTGARIDKAAGGEEETYDAIGNKVEGAKKVKKLTSAEARKAKKDRIARRKRGEEVVSLRFDYAGRNSCSFCFSSQMRSFKQAFVLPSSAPAPPTILYFQLCSFLRARRSPCPLAMSSVVLEPNACFASRCRLRRRSPSKVLECMPVAGAAETAK
jgi:hypothetical protein